jgi:D-ribulokinase
MQIMVPRDTPRPDDDAEFLHGLLEGIAGIEAMAYRRLAELGAPGLKAVFSGFFSCPATSGIDPLTT